MSKSLTLIALAGLAVVALAGCTDADQSPPVSASSTAAAEATTGSDYTIPDVSGECVDGTATIVDDSSSVTIEGDCENVVVEASNSIVTVTGAVVNLSLNSSITLVNVPSVDNVTFAEGANGNKVATPSAPAVTDGGADNIVAAE